MLSHSTQMYWLITRSHAHNYSNCLHFQILVVVPQTSSSSSRMHSATQCQQWLSIYEVRTVLNALVWEFGAWGHQGMSSTSNNVQVLSSNLLAGMQLYCCLFMQCIWTEKGAVHGWLNCGGWSAAFQHYRQTNDMCYLTPYHHHHRGTNRRVDVCRDGVEQSRKC